MRNKMALKQHNDSLEKSAIAEDLTFDEAKTIDIDEDTTSKAYCSWRFFIGFLCLFIGSVIHVVILPYLDLTLMACNAAVAIMLSIVLSIQCLDEVFVWRYDCPALVLIAAGCATIVLNAHTEPIEYTALDVK